LLIIGSGCGRDSGTGRIGVQRPLSLRPVTYGGRISYSLYLWHWPCLILLGKLAASGGSRAGSFSVAHGWRAAVAVLVALALSALSHCFIENPSRHAAWMGSSRNALAAGAAMMGATVAVAAVLLPVSQGAIRDPLFAYVAPLPVGGQVAGLSLAGSPQALVHVTLAVTLRQARDDHTVGTRDCYGSYQQSVAPPDCAFGDPNGNVDVALVGDSHAAAIFPALDRVAIANHWKLWLWAKPACPMISLTVHMPQFDATYPWCTSWQHSVLGRLAAIPGLDTVVVTGYAGVVSIPGRFSVAGGPVLATNEVPSQWARAWSVTDRELAAASRRVVVIRDVPAPRGDVPDCIAAHAPDVRQCSNTRSAALQDGLVLYRAEAPASTASTRFIDLNAALCPGDPCPVVTAGGDVIYRDDEHLTATVSAQLAPVLRAKLRGLVPVRR
jgi:SGNH domain (fused to AT3 domains)